MSARPDPDVTVVVATRNRRDEACRTVERLLSLPDPIAVVVVDDASSDGTGDALDALGDQIDVVRLRHSHGAASRNVGVRLARTPFVALSDDDSWWSAGSLRRAAALMRHHPSLGLIAARILVGADERLDPTCRAMARTPLPTSDGVPGRRVLGFVACGAVVRRDAFLAVGGFHPRLHIGGEEQLVALDLAAAGWKLAYVDDIVAHHHPSSLRDADRRRRLLVRNRLWTAWLRRPARSAMAETSRALRTSIQDRVARAGVRDAIAGAWWIRNERRPIPARLERELRLLDARRAAADVANAT